MPRDAEVCEQCGTIREAKSGVEVADGELVEYGSGARAAQRAPTSDDKAIFFAELRFIAAERGYSEGWASRKYREKFGAWPNDPRIRVATPTAPLLKTRNWVRSRAIAYAKARAHHG